MNFLFKTLIATFTLMVTLNVMAEVKITYKWFDAKGEVHYTDRIPKGVEYTEIRTYLSANHSTANTPSSSQSETKDEKTTYGTWRDENCTIAHQNLEMLKDSDRISMDDGEGGKRLMTDEEKQAQVTKMEEQRDKYCKKAQK